MDRQDRRQANSIIRFGIGWWIILITIVLLIGAAIWGIGVAVSGPKGQGDAIRQNNSAENWTAKQALFEDLYADIEASDRKIDAAAQALKADPEDKTLQANYSGIVNHCISVVGNYNAEARKFLSEDWRSIDLPDQISNNDPSTDCKESE